MKLLALIVLLMLATTASASEHCKNDGSDPDNILCASEGLDVSEATLNKRYQLALARLQEYGKEFPAALDARRKLIEAQRLWVKFRDVDCDAAFTLNSGGTIAVPMSIACMSDHADQRTKELDSLYQF